MSFIPLYTINHSDHLAAVIHSSMYHYIMQSFITQHSTSLSLISLRTIRSLSPTHTCHPFPYVQCYHPVLHVPVTHFTKAITSFNPHCIYHPFTIQGYHSFLNVPIIPYTPYTTTSLSPPCTLTILYTMTPVNPPCHCHSFSMYHDTT